MDLWKKPRPRPVVWSCEVPPDPLESRRRPLWLLRSRDGRPRTVHGHARAKAMLTVTSTPVSLPNNQPSARSCAASGSPLRAAICHLTLRDQDLRQSRPSLCRGSGRRIFRAQAACQQRDTGCRQNQQRQSSQNRGDVGWSHPPLRPDDDAAIECLVAVRA